MQLRTDPISALKIEASEEGIGDDEPRCDCCKRKLAEFVTRPWVIKCSRCKHVNERQSVPCDRSEGAV